LGKRGGNLMDPFDKIISSFINQVTGEKTETVYTSHKALGGIWLVSKRSSYRPSSDITVSTIHVGGEFTATYDPSLDGFTQLNSIGQMTALMWVIPYNLALVCNAIAQSECYFSKGEMRELIYRLTQITEGKTPIQPIGVMLDYGGIIATVTERDSQFYHGRQLGRNTPAYSIMDCPPFIPIAIRPSAEVIQCIVP
jgi:hypothetical protein